LLSDFLAPHRLSGVAGSVRFCLVVTTTTVIIIITTIVIIITKIFLFAFTGSRFF